MTSRLTLLTLCLLVFSLQSTHAQDLDTVTISGRVMDQNGAVIPGAEIQATLSKTQLTRKTTSNAQGRYRLVQLEPGSYVLRVSATGFAAQQIENVWKKMGTGFSATLCYGGHDRQTDHEARQPVVEDRADVAVREAALVIGIAGHAGRRTGGFLHHDTPFPFLHRPLAGRLT